MPYANPSSGQHGMQPPMSPGALSQGKDQNDMSNGANNPVNMGYNGAMNNPIPNPANPPVNSNNNNPSLNRSNSFENEQMYPEEMGRNEQGMHFSGGRNNKRRYPSNQMPSQALPPSEGYMSQPRKSIPRRPPPFPQQGTPVSQSPQGTGQTQSTPPNHNSPQNQSPSEGMGHSKQNYTPAPPYYPAAGKTQFSASGYPPVPPGSGNPPGPSTFMAYPQQQANYPEQPNAINPNSYNNTNYFTSSMKGPGGNNYMVSGGQQKAIYAHPPSGRFGGMPALAMSKKPQYLASKQGNSNPLHDPTEGGDSIGQTDRDSGVDSILSNDTLYRPISDTDNIYSSEQSINTEGPIDTLFM